MPKGSLQDLFLNLLRKAKVPVSIYLVNGIKLQGVIESFDQFVVTLKNTVSQMVYKHAISTVVPTRDIIASPYEQRHHHYQYTTNKTSVPLSSDHKDPIADHKDPAVCSEE